MDDLLKGIFRSGRWVFLIFAVLLMPALVFSDSKDIFFNDMAGNYDVLSSPAIPGKSYYRNEYPGVGPEQYDIEYIAGNLPIIISVPHGGYFFPDGMAYNWGFQGPDFETMQMALQLYLKIYKATGGYPHMIINRVSKYLLNMNRHHADLTCMYTNAIDSRSKLAWDDYHYFIDEAKRLSIEQNGFGFFVDFHGQSDDAKSMLGYGVFKSEMDNKTEAELDALIGTSSLQDISNRSAVPFSGLLTGEFGFGQILHENEVVYAIPEDHNKCMPSQADPVIINGYKSGHYNLYRHCGMNSLDRYEKLYSSSVASVMVDEYNSTFHDPIFSDAQGISKISGTIVECNSKVRKEYKEKMCLALADSIVQYVQHHYDVILSEWVSNDSVVMLEENFEPNSDFDSWEGIWYRDQTMASAGESCAKADYNHDGNFTSPPLNGLNAREITVSFNFRKHSLEDEDLVLYFGAGDEYWEIPINMEDEGENDGWIFYSCTVTDSKYFTNDFKVRFRANTLVNSYWTGNEQLFIDSLYVTKKIDFGE